MPAEGGGQAVRELRGAGRRPGPVPGRTPDPGPAGFRRRAVLALVPAQPPGGGAERRLGAVPGLHGGGVAVGGRGHGGEEPGDRRGEGGRGPLGGGGGGGAEGGGGGREGGRGQLAAGGRAGGRGADDAAAAHQQGAGGHGAGRGPGDARIQAVHDAGRAGGRAASVQTRRGVHQPGGDPGGGAHATGPDVPAARQEQGGAGTVPKGLRDRQGAGGAEEGDRRLPPQPGARAGQPCRHGKGNRPKHAGSPGAEPGSAGPVGGHRSAPQGRRERPGVDEEVGREGRPGGSEHARRRDV